MVPRAAVIRGAHGMGGLEDGDSNPAKVIETMFVFLLLM